MTKNYFAEKQVFYFNIIQKKKRIFVYLYKNFLYIKQVAFSNATDHCYCKPVFRLFMPHIVFINLFKIISFFFYAIETITQWGAAHPLLVGFNVSLLFFL